MRPRLAPTPGAPPTAALGTGLRRYDGLERGRFSGANRTHKIAENSKRPASPETPPVIPVIRRRPESRNHARRAHPPGLAARVRSPSSAALGTGLRRYDGLERGRFSRRQSHPQARRTANAPPSSPKPSFRRRPESRNHARHRTTRPNRHPASEAPSSAALGTGLRRYDGLERGRFSPLTPIAPTSAENSKRPHGKPPKPRHSGEGRIQNPHPVPRHTPEAGDERPEPHQAPHQPPEPAPRDRSPTQRQTAHRPTPVRRARAGCACTRANPAQPPTRDLTD